MVRVALVSEPPDGGVAEHIRQLALGLPAHGYTPVVMVSEDYIHLEQLRGSCEVMILPFRRDYSDPRREMRSLSELLPAVRGVDIVHAHSAKAGVLGRVAARLGRRPAVYTPHGFPFIGEMSSARRVFSHVVERALARTTDALICVCEAERGFAADRRLRPRSTAVVYNGCPSHSDVGDSVELPGGLIVGTVCMLRPEKAIDCLLDAMPAITAAVPQARLVIVGDGPMGAMLRSHAADLGVEVSWLAFEPPAARYLQSFDVYVLSSAWESFPIAVLEAMSCGVPQVVSRVGGTQESVVAETGLLVPPRDPDALADAVIELLRDPARRAAMSEASRERHAAFFTTERMVADTAAVYDRLLAGG